MKNKRLISSLYLLTGMFLFLAGHLLHPLAHQSGACGCGLPAGRCAASAVSGTAARADARLITVGKSIHALNPHHCLICSGFFIAAPDFTVKTLLPEIFTPNEEEIPGPVPPSGILSTNASRAPPRPSGLPVLS